MNLTEVLAILKEVNLLVSSLQAMGLKVEGTVSLTTLLSLFGTKL